MDAAVAASAGGFQKEKYQGEAKKTDQCVSKEGNRLASGSRSMQINNLKKK